MLEGNSLKFCTLMYLDHLQNWLVYGHGLLIFQILALFWLSEMGQIWGFRAFPRECMEGMAWNFACWCILFPIYFRVQFASSSLGESYYCWSSNGVAWKIWQIWQMRIQIKNPKSQTICTIFWIYGSLQVSSSVPFLITVRKKYVCKILCLCLWFAFHESAG